MKIKSLILISSLTVILINCREGINEIVEEEKNIRTGWTTNAIFFSELEKPDTIFIDTSHKNIKSLDVNNDGIDELEIVSSEDTIAIKVSNEVTRYYHTKTLSLNKLRDNIYISVESMDYPLFVGIIQQNSILGFENQIWDSLDSVKIFCQLEKNLKSELSLEMGMWNERHNKYFALNFQHEGQTIMAWIELTVIEYDNYILHNFASFVVE